MRSPRKWLWLAPFCLAHAGSRLLAAEPAEGLVATYVVKEASGPAWSDVVVEPNVALSVPAGFPPTPFLPALPTRAQAGDTVRPGKFQVAWTGYLSAELRTAYEFVAVLNGGLELEINGKKVFQATSAGAASRPSPPVTLNKGLNQFRAAYTSPDQGDAFLRLLWREAEEGTVLEPVDRRFFSHPTPQPTLDARDRLRLGREVLFEYRCLKCHAEPISAAVPDASMDAPSFEGIGSRRAYDWMRQWILHPQALRPSAFMPRLLNDENAADESVALAAFLSSQTSIRDHPASVRASKVDAQNGRKLFDSLLCTACHNPPDTPKADPTKITLNHVRQQFTAGSLQSFLLEPERHFAWIRMPNFRLSAVEAQQLAAFLEQSAGPAPDITAPNSPAILARGKHLLQTRGCLNCHPMDLPNEYEAPTLSSLKPEAWTKGCLADQPPADPRVPIFQLAPREKAALRAFAATDRSALGRQCDTEFAERQSRLLKCTGCHGRHEGFPPFEILGAKLKPEWIDAFLSGQIQYKPRPWLPARMPEFKTPAPYLARGLVRQHGFPPSTPPAPPIDLAAAAIGRKLAGPDGGFNCVSCHSVGPVKATQVFESEGVNLAHSASRLLHAYYHRWVLNPLQIDAQTKMPAFFDQGRSPLIEIFDGDAEKQIEAIWQVPSARRQNAVSTPATVSLENANQNPSPRPTYPKSNL